MSTSPYFFCCEVSSLLKGNALWNTMMVEKAFFKSTYGSFGGITACSVGKSVSSMSIPVRTNAAPSMMGAVQCNQPATRYLADYTREWYYIGAQSWSLLLARCTLRVGHSCAGLGRWKSMVLSLCITTTLPPLPLCSWVHWAVTEVSVKRGWMVPTEWVILPTYLPTLNYSSGEVTLWWAFTWDINIFISFSHSERSIHTLLL